MHHKSNPHHIKTSYIILHISTASVLKKKLLCGKRKENTECKHIHTYIFTERQIYRLKKVKQVH